MFLLQSDHGIRLALATEIGMESEDSDHTSLMINCPVMFRSALAPYDHLHIYGIGEQKITINWCTRAEISDSLAILFIFRGFETALLVQCRSYTLFLQGLCTVSLKFTSHKQ